ncbi:MAG: hypothetical protein M3Y62_05325 [Candidatus Dormibacteraeota bacterium]|nr:hypothetical protein [Candidatus Dormibacteraeota bacterium]
MATHFPLPSLTLRVPAPFSGVEELGFSARYPEQGLFSPLRDVPLWIEGPARPMARLMHRLHMLAATSAADHGWRDPVALSDEVMIIAFHGSAPAAEDGALVRPEPNYLLNLVRPVVFPFLRDCAEVAHLRLSESIDVGVLHSDATLAELTLRLADITSSNGEDLLVA